MASRSNAGQTPARAARQGNNVHTLAEYSEREQKREQSRRGVTNEERAATEKTAASKVLSDIQTFKKDVLTDGKSKRDRTQKFEEKVTAKGANSKIGMYSS
jgi:hypothetical protein